MQRGEKISQVLIQEGPIRTMFSITEKSAQLGFAYFFVY
ncbi:MAG: hypothetical protein ACI9YU_001866, partial [Flavobacteriales bacterium]